MSCCKPATGVTAAQEPDELAHKFRYSEVNKLYEVTSMAEESFSRRTLAKAQVEFLEMEACGERGIRDDVSPLRDVDRHQHDQGTLVER
jgi:hypothetical protein